MLASETPAIVHPAIDSGPTDNHVTNGGCSHFGIGGASGPDWIGAASGPGYRGDCRARRTGGASGPDWIGSASGPDYRGDRRRAELEAPRVLTESEPPRALTTEEIARRTNQAIAFVKGRRGFGTGFVVRPGLVATNAHVILLEREKTLRVSFPGAPSRFLSVRILLEDPQRDLALLAVPTNVPPLEIEPAYRLRHGQEVTVIGNPGLSDTVVLKNAVCRGVMSTDAVIKGQKFFQLSIAINPGNSGGPVLDSSGKVIGVIVAKAFQKEGMAFCIPAADLLSGIAKVESRFTDKSLVSATHSARYVAAWLDNVGKAYVVVLDQALTSMDRALAQRLDPTLAITQVRQEVSGPLRELEVILSNDLHPEMDRVYNDARIAASIRQGLVEAWKNCQAMKTSIDSPEGTTKTYRARAALLRDRHGSLVDRLRDDLEMRRP